MGRPLIDLTGQKFGRLTVIRRGQNKGNHAAWFCKCDCGNPELKLVSGDYLRSGKIQSCGCYNLERIRETKTKHGFAKSRLYIIWKNMKSRCQYPGATHYALYGGRGITVCADWQEFMPFMEWAMSNGYSDVLTLDRIDVNGNYEPSNCRWLSQKSQCNNKRDNRYIEYNGEIKTLQEWSDLRGLGVGVLYYRLQMGWNVGKAIMTPSRKQTA